MNDWITIRYDPKDVIPIDDFEEVKKLLEAACSDAIVSKLEQDILYDMKGEQNG